MSSIIIGCEQIEEKTIAVSDEILTAKSYGCKYPFISVYVEAIPLFQALSSTAYGMDVYCAGGNRPRDVVIDRDGYTITQDMVK